MFAIPVLAGLTDALTWVMFDITVSGINWHQDKIMLVLIGFVSIVLACIVGIFFWSDQ